MVLKYLRDEKEIPKNLETNKPKIETGKILKCLLKPKTLTKIQHGNDSYLL